MGPKILKSAKVWSLTLIRFSISFKFLLCTAIDPIGGEIEYWGLVWFGYYAWTLDMYAVAEA